MSKPRNNYRKILEEFRQALDTDPEYIESAADWLELKLSDMTPEARSITDHWSEGDVDKALAILERFDAVYHRPHRIIINTKEKDTVTNKKNTPKTEAEKIQVAPEEDTESKLSTNWADATNEPSFDTDQIDVHEWTLADEAEREAALSLEMRLSDVEELIFTARDVAQTHVERADAALLLAEALRNRLARTYITSTEQDGDAESDAEIDETPQPRPVAASDETTQIPKFLQEG